jgi:hypothetical protein
MCKEVVEAYLSQYFDPRLQGLSYTTNSFSRDNRHPDGGTNKRYRKYLGVMSRMFGTCSLYYMHFILRDLFGFFKYKHETNSPIFIPHIFTSLNIGFEELLL